MRLTFILLCVLYLPFAQARDYGVMGKTWVIAEADFLEYIQNKIKTMQENGEWQTLQSAFAKRVKAHIARPPSITLPRAERERIWYFDPSIEVPYTIYDTKGQVIVQKGVVVNPLERVKLSSTLVIFDGDDPEQVSWAKNTLENEQKVRLVLTSGSVKETASQFKQAVYFDLNAFLIDKFHINALPAMVKQKQNRLMIQEVHL